MMQDFGLLTTKWENIINKLKSGGIISDYAASLLITDFIFSI